VGLFNVTAVQISGLAEMWKAKGTTAGERLSS
jgi:hypothetical protein